MIILIADVEVEVLAKTQASVIGVPVLAPTVQELMQAKDVHLERRLYTAGEMDSLVNVVLAAAAVGEASVGGAVLSWHERLERRIAHTENTYKGETTLPAVVLTNADQDVSAVRSQSASKVFSTSADVESLKIQSQTVLIL